VAPRTDFEFHLQTFPTGGIPDLRPFFDDLPLDPYISGHFRRRRYSHFRGPAHAIERLRHARFLQSKNVNYLQGGLAREFQELDPKLVALREFKDIVACFIDWVQIDPKTREFGVHQIRILCSPEFSGDPAPEGIHKDGFDFVGIFCIARHNVIGAETHLYRDKAQPPIFNRALQPGEVVFTNDRAVFHYTDTVRPATPAPGHRDVFVITA
jgi:hypothetical protein